MFFHFRPTSSPPLGTTRAYFWNQALFGSVKELKESQCSAVRSSVRLVLVCLELLFFIRFFRMPSGQSQVSLRSLCAYFVRQNEPKILRLVVLSFIVRLLHLYLFTFPWWLCRDHYYKRWMARVQRVDRARTRIQTLENQSFQGVCKQKRSPHPHSGHNDNAPINIVKPWSKSKSKPLSQQTPK